MLVVWHAKSANIGIFLRRKHRLYVPIHRNFGSLYCFTNLSYEGPVIFFQTDDRGMRLGSGINCFHFGVLLHNKPVKWGTLLNYYLDIEPIFRSPAITELVIRVDRYSDARYDIEQLVRVACKYSFAARKGSYSGGERATFQL